MTDNEEHAHHITPIKVYLKTFGILIFLTLATVITSYYDFGTWNLAIALLIASTKAILVMLFFMQLKYDDIGNKITFYSSFIFLAIFFTFIWSDVYFRTEVQPLKIDAVQGAGGGETDPHRLNVANADLVAKGQKVFTVQCTSCHGVNGMGDGAAAAALNPKPRNFKSGYWRYGGTPSKIFRTLTQGSPGTAMAAFTTLSVEDRYALAHYVRSIATPTPPQDTTEDINEAVKLVGTGATSASQEIPVDYAIEKMQMNDQIVMPQEAKNMDHPGAFIFKNQCAQCHGAAGQGAQISAVGVNPPVYMITMPLAESKSGAMQSESTFMKMVSEGIPGRGMPGMAGYSPQEWTNLYNYVKTLRK